MNEEENPELYTKGKKTIAVRITTRNIFLYIFDKEANEMNIN